MDVGLREGLGQFLVSGLGKGVGGGTRPTTANPEEEVDWGGGAVRSLVFRHLESRMPCRHPNGASRRHLDLRN